MPLGTQRYKSQKKYSLRFKEHWIFNSCIYKINVVVHLSPNSTSEDEFFRASRYCPNTQNIEEKSKTPKSSTTEKLDQSSACNIIYFSVENCQNMLLKHLPLKRDYSSLYAHQKNCIDYFRSQIMGKNIYSK